MTMTETDLIVAGPPAEWSAHHVPTPGIIDRESGEHIEPGWYVSAHAPGEQDEVYATLQVQFAVDPEGREDAEAVAKRLVALLSSDIVTAAERTCATIERQLNADASEGTPIWEWTDEEADGAVREVLTAGDELMAAVDAATEATR